MVKLVGSTSDKVANLRHQLGRAWAHIDYLEASRHGHEEGRLNHEIAEHKETIKTLTAENQTLRQQLAALTAPAGTNVVENDNTTSAAPRPNRRREPRGPVTRVHRDLALMEPELDEDNRREIDTFSYGYNREKYYYRNGELLRVEPPVFLVEPKVPRYRQKTVTSEAREVKTKANNNQFDYLRSRPTSIRQMPTQRRLPRTGGYSNGGEGSADWNISPDFWEVETWPSGLITPETQSPPSSPEAGRSASPRARSVSPVAQQTPRIPNDNLFSAVFVPAGFSLDVPDIFWDTRIPSRVGHKAIRHGLIIMQQALWHTSRQYWPRTFRQFRNGYFLIELSMSAMAYTLNLLEPGELELACGNEESARRFRNLMTGNVKEARNLDSHPKDHEFTDGRKIDDYLIHIEEAIHLLRQPLYLRKVRQLREKVASFPRDAMKRVEAMELLIDTPFWKPDGRLVGVLQDLDSKLETLILGHWRGVTYTGIEATLVRVGLIWLNHPEVGPGCKQLIAPSFRLW